MYNDNRVMDYLQDNWGSFVSVLGLVATVFGLGVVFRRAGEARKSAADARTAAQETQQAISNVLTIVDLERAIAMVQRLKQLHRDRKWEVSLELYQPLRVMLTNINTRGTIERAELREAIPQIRVIEDGITRAIFDGVEPAGARNFPRVLNNIQMSLEEIASPAHLTGSEVR